MKGSTTGKKLSNRKSKNKENKKRNRQGVEESLDSHGNVLTFEQNEDNKGKIRYSQNLYLVYFNFWGLVFIDKKSINWHLNPIYYIFLAPK